MRSPPRSRPPPAPRPPLADALATAIASAADVTFRDVVRELLARREAVTRWIAKAGGVVGAVDDLARALGIDPADDLARLDAELVDGPLLPSSDWLAVAALCEEGSTSDCDQGAQL